MRTTLRYELNRKLKDLNRICSNLERLKVRIEERQKEISKLKSDNTKEMKEIIGVFLKIMLFVGVLGVWYAILKLLFLFPTKYEHSDEVKRWLGY